MSCNGLWPVAGFSLVFIIRLRLGKRRRGGRRKGKRGRREERKGTYESLTSGATTGSSERNELLWLDFFGEDGFRGVLWGVGTRSKWAGTKLARLKPWVLMGPLSVGG